MLEAPDGVLLTSDTIDLIVGMDFNKLQPNANPILPFYAYVFLPCLDVL